MLNSTGRMVITFEYADQNTADKVVSMTGETIEQVIEKLTGHQCFVDFLEDHADLCCGCDYEKEKGHEKD
jgi:hypothetical protein